jgi:uncharacterized repeat protein (TIGR02543 family)
MNFKLIKTEMFLERIKGVKVLASLCIFMFALILSQPVAAQYTLTDDDVVITDGIIQECFYSYEETDIIIPEQLQDQTVTGIVDGADAFHGVFGWKDLTSIKFPKTIEYIGNYSCRDNEFTTIDFSGCDELTYIGVESFCRTPIASIDFTGCTSLTTIQASAFRVCYLTEVDLSTCVNLDYIGYGTFRDNSITSVDISGCNRLKTIAVSAFKTNPGLLGVILPDVNTEGYALDFWKASTNDTDFWELAAGDSLTDFVALYVAQMKIATYTITYNTNGGTHSNPVEYTMESDTILLSDASQEGYNFMGWYDNAEFTDDAITEIPTGSYGDMELWAKFDIIVTTYNITYNADGGTHSNPSTYTNVENVTLSAAVKTDYKFMGWYDNAEFTGDAMTEIVEGTSGDLEFWAKFEEGSGVSDDINSMLSIYPNPVNKNLTLNYSQLTIESVRLINTNGKVVYAMSTIGSTQSSIDMENFDAGLYYVVFTTTNGDIISKKIVKAN